MMLACVQNRRDAAIILVDFEQLRDTVKLRVRIPPRKSIAPPPPPPRSSVDDEILPRI